MSPSRRDELTARSLLKEVHRGPILGDLGMQVSPLQCLLECKAVGVPRCRYSFLEVCICLDSVRYAGGLDNLMQVVHY